MRLYSTLISGVAVGMLCVAAVAQEAPPQRGGGTGTGAGAPPPQRGADGQSGFSRGQLAPEKAKAAWESQARHVAQGLGLNEDQTKNVVAAYISSREQHAEAMLQLMEKARENRGNPTGEDQDARREGMQKAFADLNKADREKLQTELAKSMNADQVGKAIVPLGAFNPNWDTMVSTLADLKLDQLTNKQVMDATQSYVTVIAKAADDTDPEARRTANQQARAKLTETVKPILTEEQYRQFERAMGGPRGAARRVGSDGATPARPGADAGRGGRGGTGAGGARGGRGGGQTPSGGQTPGGTPQ